MLLQRCHDTFTEIYNGYYILLPTATIKGSAATIQALLLFVNSAFLMNLHFWGLSIWFSSH